MDGHILWPMSETSKPMATSASSDLRIGEGEKPIDEPFALPWCHCVMKKKGLLSVEPATI